MIGGMRVVDDGPPQIGGEDDDGKQKEYAGDFEPKDSADAAEGPQKAA